MAKATLPTNFKDDVMASAMGGKRRYNLIQNSDGTYSLEDVTNYTQVGSDFGAAQVNATNNAVNQSVDKAVVIDNLDDIAANTTAGKVAGALAVRELNSKMLDHVVEQGTTYTKWASGKMECWGRCTTAGNTGTVVVTLPVSFKAADYVILLTPDYYGGSYITFECSAQRASASTFNVYTRQSGGGILGGVICEWYTVGN